MPSIFDFVTAPEIGAYWNELSQDEAPYLGEELFPADKKLGLNLSWIKGSRGLPVMLKASAFDVYAVPRPRMGFEISQAQMPYFKESMYVDEELRQELNRVLESGNPSYRDVILNRIFDDTTNLLRGAAATREVLRMQALTTGAVALTSNGQTYAYDYGIPEEHKVDASAKWSLADSADPLEDIRVAKEMIQDETGAVLTRAVCDGKTWRNLRNNDGFKKAIYVLTQGVGAGINDAQLHSFIMDQVGIDITVYDKRYRDEAGETHKFMPENTFVMFPDGPLGRTWFGTTPAESDLMSSSVANVSVVDTGVSVTTAQKVDPVNVETIVAQICLPSFEEAENVVILDTEAGE